MAKQKRKARPKPYRVSVRLKDIREGESRDCFRCAVARALQRATGDDHAHVYEDGFVTYLEAWSRHILCPVGVRAFVWAYDALPRDPKTRRPLLPKTLPEELGPFAFELPPQDSPEWQERCYVCEELFPSEELDDEGICHGCQD